MYTVKVIYSRGWGLEAITKRFNNFHDCKVFAESWEAKHNTKIEEFRPMLGKVLVPYLIESIRFDYPSGKHHTKRIMK